MPKSPQIYLSPSASRSLFNLMEIQCLDEIQTSLCLQRVLEDVMWEAAVKREWDQLNRNRVENLKRILQPNNGLLKSSGKAAPAWQLALTFLLPFETAQENQSPLLGEQPLHMWNFSGPSVYSESIHHIYRKVRYNRTAGLWVLFKFTAFWKRHFKNSAQSALVMKEPSDGVICVSKVIKDTKPGQERLGWAWLKAHKYRAALPRWSCLIQKHIDYKYFHNICCYSSCVWGNWNPKSGVLMNQVKCTERPRDRQGIVIAKKKKNMILWANAWWCRSFID